MKKLLSYLVTLCLLLIMCSCTDNIKSPLVQEELLKSDYKGPRNSSEFEFLIENSQNPVLLELDRATKKSLVEFTVFKENRLRGFSGSDVNIKRIKRTNILEVLSAILKANVVERSSVSSRAYGFSFCENCWWQRDDSNCCQVGGDGCIDY